jgi:hypothetical protein
MALVLRFVTACSALLLSSATASAQLPVAPEPHLALDELVKEYKRLGLPLPPPNAELVRFRYANRPAELGFHVIGPGLRQRIGAYERVKPETAALRDVEPHLVMDFLRLAVQCRERGWNEFAALLFARAQEAITTPVPARTEERESLAPISGVNLVVKWRTGRLNGWALRTVNSSALKELRREATIYWSARVMVHSDRAEVLRHLKELEPWSDDIAALERTLATRKSKPGTVEALIDDLTDYSYSDAAATDPLGADRRGEAAYRKLVELGFDAVPTLIEHLGDERLTRSTHSEHTGCGTFGAVFTFHRTLVGHVVGKILNDLSGRALSEEFEAPSVTAEKARAWWKETQKAGEEKWLVARAAAAAADVGAEITRTDGSSTNSPANRVLFRALGAKYPKRLGELYRTALSKQPEWDTGALADEVAGSKLPRAEKLALLVEGAEHKHLDHRLSALRALAGVDERTFSKYLLATLKAPPDPEVTWNYPLQLLAVVQRTDDATCWDALAELVRQSASQDRFDLVWSLWADPNANKSVRRETVRFLLRFLFDESVKTPNAAERRMPASVERVSDIATVALAWQLGIDIDIDPNRGPLSRLLIRAALAKAAAEELERLKK